MQSRVRSKRDSGDQPLLICEACVCTLHSATGQALSMTCRVHCYIHGSWSVGNSTWKRELIIQRQPGFPPPFRVPISEHLQSVALYPACLRTTPPTQNVSDSYLANSGGKAVTTTTRGTSTWCSFAAAAASIGRNTAMATAGFDMPQADISIERSCADNFVYSCFCAYLREVDAHALVSVCLSVCMVV